MDVMTYTEARANLKGVMDRVVSDRTQVVVTRQKSEAVVMMSLADWNAVEEMLHLLSTPSNAARLRGSRNLSSSTQLSWWMGSGSSAKAASLGRSCSRCRSTTSRSTPR
jgi:antitoxin YefM